MLDDAVPDTSFVTKDVPSPSPPFCIVDSVERARVVPSDPSVHVYDVPVSTTSSLPTVAQFVLSLLRLCVLHHLYGKT